MPFVFTNKGAKKEDAAKWIEKVMQAEKDPMKVWDILKHGKRHYGEMSSPQLRQAYAAAFPDFSDTLDPHYRYIEMWQVNEQTRLRTDPKYAKHALNVSP